MTRLDPGTPSAPDFQHGRRLAVIQHGDYRDALRLRASGQGEPYTGMYYTLDVLEDLAAGMPTMIASIDAPRYRESRGPVELVGFAAPRWKKGGKVPWAWDAYRAVRAFRPTHILMRTGGAIATPILRYAAKRKISSLVLMAGYLDPSDLVDRLVLKSFVKALNDPSVFLVGNHRRPAAESLITRGVRPEKVVAYDWPDLPHPSQFAVKSLPASGPCRVMYAGTISRGKGAADLLEAVIVLHDSGFPIRLSICGYGIDLEPLKARAAEALPDGVAEFHGRVPNRRIVELMREATLVCVPSRRESSEGLPFVVTEALASRTPLIASTHPSLTDALRDGEGLRFFRSGDPGDLARAIREATADPEIYARLSEGTAPAYARIECPTHFHHLIDRWRASW